MTGIRVEQKLFEDVFRASLPKLASHLEACGLPLSIVTTNWFMCLYVNTLPAETLLRVWDRASPDCAAVPAPRALEHGASSLERWVPSVFSLFVFSPAQPLLRSSSARTLMPHARLPTYHIWQCSSSRIPLCSCAWGSRCSSSPRPSY